MQRITIKDIARAAGVSPSAVSFALNNRPGVSKEKREKIMEVADELGWRPSFFARSLPSAKANTVGLVIARPARSVNAESFYFRFICGVEQVLVASSYNFMLKIVDSIEEEMETYRSWWLDRSVDGVLLVDIRDHDPRVEVLEKYELPYVIVGNAPESIRSNNRLELRTPDAGAMQMVLEHLAQTGVKQVAYLSGFARMSHTQQRIEAFNRNAQELGLEAQTLETDFTEEAGAQKTLDLIAQMGTPLGIVFDNEVLALGGLSAVKAQGLKIPQEVKLVSWEDSFVCRIVSPQLTAVSRDSGRLGQEAAALLLRRFGSHETASTDFEMPELVVRASSVGR
ncbi:hypothetical protein BSR29_02125 [Boudabousia liubingyangii]|uniref:HTH lacI-type domain-containing protein n=1 Tax=Boudabousia liubingyangii TaxID=1921764 RepID=A0A1Q5PQF8_9ACTO|nr:LacI family DNA-binding transcriptional regulator [Boudabousia liubingyangii]OKL49766.1 hypothetical protein BSR29_02125 [Boudabousia liubingyangii]